MGVAVGSDPWFEAGVELSAGRVGKAPGMGKQLNQRQMTDSSFFCDGKPPNHMAIELGYNGICNL